VTRVWDHPSQLKTSTIPSGSQELDSKWDLQPGDVLNRVGVHVVLFQGWSGNLPRVFESTTTGGADRVVYVVRDWSYLSVPPYEPREYNNVCP